MGLSILQWNAYSILAHGSEFKYLLDQMESVPHILCIQETFLKPEITYNLKGYSLIRNDGKNGRVELQHIYGMMYNIQRLNTLKVLMEYQFMFILHMVQFK